MNNYRKIAGALLTIVLAVPAAASAKTYKVDPDHTTVAFRIRHLFSYVEGRFKQFEGRIEFDPKTPEKTRVQGSILVASIDTGVPERDKHLRSKDFFDVEKYPRITFESTRVSDIDPKAMKAKLHGKLTIHGVTRDVVLDVAFLGEGKDPWGNTKAGFTARGKINRKDFGLGWNEVLETGGLLVGEEVELRVDAEGAAE
ncbi:MAG: polyisoprenoid-binding protein [Candidatus Dadabacteria bacterium]|nr:MAG: polyisoprenoid-binding protein [Candidatus Dadabacteria bacterium]